MTTATAPARFLTPPTIARQLGVKPERVVNWIKTGRLRAVDLSEPGSLRPRYKVDPVDLTAFLNSRAVAAPPKPSRRRRENAVTEFF